MYYVVTASTDLTTRGSAHPLLFVCHLFGENRRGAGLRPLQRERLCPPSPRCDCGKGRLSESFQQLSTPAPRSLASIWAVAGDEHLGPGT
jgi:hypothetical protein